MKVTVHHNEADCSYFGFTPSKAELVDAGTYDLPVTEYIPDFAGMVTVMEPEVAASEQEAYAMSVLNRIYEQLNVGGDLIPAEAYTEAYRAAGGRSLSVGDLVTLDDDRSVLGVRGTYAVDKIGFRRVPASRLVIRWGLARRERNQEAFAW
jgi:hypothetical protein